MSKESPIDPEVFRSTQREIRRVMQTPWKSLDQEQLDDLVSRHALWLEGSRSGMRADLSFCGLEKLTLKEVDLSGALLMGCHFDYCDLVRIRLKGADLTGAAFFLTDMMDADLRDCALDGACFHSVNLHWADLRGASFEQTAFVGARVGDTLFSKPLIGTPDIFAGVEITKRMPLREYLKNGDDNAIDFPKG